MDFFLNMTWGDINNGDVGPGAFSWFHLMWLGIMIAGCIILGITVAKKHNPKYDWIVIAVFAALLLGCEVFKQFFWLEFYGYYRFEVFPYQFCSVPIYISILATLIPGGRIRESCYRFLAFYGIIGGLSIMLVPSAVLHTYFIPMSIHSMLWHTVLVVIGVYLIVSRGYGKNLRELLSPCILFLCLVAIAIVGNILIYKLHLNTPACQPGDNLSMFYISPYYPTQIPLLGAVQNISYPLFVLSYLVLFNLFSFLVWGVSKIVRTVRSAKK
ncbi:MAG: YwaF family protein [Clostridia bacterium]|nr:YwaF family protein [Clostridia bacterium]